MPTIITLNNNNTSSDTPTAVTVSHRVHFSRVTNRNDGQDADICRIDLTGTIVPANGLEVVFIADQDLDLNSTGGDGWRFIGVGSDDTGCAGFSNRNVLGSGLINSLDDTVRCEYREFLVRSGTSVGPGWLCSQ